MHARELLDRAILLQERGQLAEAEACLQEVCNSEAVGFQGEARLRLGQVLLGMGRPAEAEASLRLAVGMREDAAPHHQLGLALMAQGRPGPAAEAFAQAAAIDPLDVPSFVMLGHARQAEGRLADAVRAYETALLRDGGNVATRYYLAEALIRSKDLRRAFGQLHLLLQREPGYVPAIVLKGDIAFHTGDFRQAISEYGNAIAREPVEAPVYERLGRAFLEIGDEDRAFKAFVSGVRCDATSWLCHLALARLCEAKGWPRRAQWYYQTLLASPEHLAEASEGLSRVGEAIAILEAQDAAWDEEPGEDALEGFQTPQA